MFKNTRAFSGFSVSDISEALSIAARIPTLNMGGSIEVRPLDPSPGG